MAEPKFKSVAERVHAALLKVKPKKGEAGHVDVAMSQDGVFSEIQYVLLTGIKPFDDLVGGLPFGRVVEYFGLEACGKTALCKLSARQASQGNVYQRILRPDKTYDLARLEEGSYDISVLYVDNEHSLDESTVPDNWHVARAETVELMFKLVDKTVQTLEEIQEETKRMQFLLVIVDTIAGTASKEELGQEWGKDDYSRRPKQLQEGFRNMVQQLNRQNVCMVCTNQVGDNIGYVEPYGMRLAAGTLNPDKYSAPGGKALKFWSTTRIFMHQVPTKYTLVKGAQFPAGFVTAFETVKNRIKKPKRQGRMVLIFHDDPELGGFRNDLSILETLMFLKFAERSSDGAGEDEIIFKFRKNGVPLTTFGNMGKTLEEMDVEAKPGKGRYKDPRITSKAAWPAFYKDHLADFQALWQKAVEYSMTVEGINGEPVKADEDDDNQESEEAAEIKPTKRGGRNPLKVEV